MKYHENLPRFASKNDPNLRSDYGELTILGTYFQPINPHQDLS